MFEQDTDCPAVQLVLEIQQVRFDQLPVTAEGRPDADVDHRGDQLGTDTGARCVDASHRDRHTDWKRNVGSWESNRTASPIPSHYLAPQLECSSESLTGCGDVTQRNEVADTR